MSDPNATLIPWGPNRTIDGGPPRPHHFIREAAPAAPPRQPFFSRPRPVLAVLLAIPHALFVGVALAALISNARNEDHIIIPMILGLLFSYMILGTVASMYRDDEISVGKLLQTVLLVGMGFSVAFRLLWGLRRTVDGGFTFDYHVGRPFFALTVLFLVLLFYAVPVARLMYGPRHRQPPSSPS